MKGKGRPAIARWMRVAAAGAARLAAAAMLATMALAADACGATVVSEEARVDPALVARLFRLDEERIDARDVAEVLARFPAPRIVLLQGSIAFVDMEPFARFLIAMGYPAAQIGIPGEASRSTGSFVDSRRLAGMLAWFYERERVRPLLIGHSQGGMLVIRVLYDLAGAFGSEIPVWNPQTGAAEDRTAIVDPATGASRRVVGLRLPYAAALATGKLPRLILGQWSMLPKLRRVPDTVEEFTGFALEWDLIAGELGRVEPYAATGTAAVRNVILPATYSHVGLPLTEHLAQNATTRAWIEAYVPDAHAAIPDAPGIDTTNAVQAADIWHSVKKHWCLEARAEIAERREER